MNGDYSKWSLSDVRGDLVARGDLEVHCNPYNLRVHILQEVPAYHGNRRDLGLAEEVDMWASEVQRQLEE